MDGNTNPSTWVDLPEGWELTKQAGLGSFEEYHLTGTNQMVYTLRISQRDWVSAPERMEQAVRNWVWDTVQKNGKNMVLQEKANDDSSNRGRVV